MASSSLSLSDALLIEEDNRSPSSIFHQKEIIDDVLKSDPQKKLDSSDDDDDASVSSDGSFDLLTEFRKSRSNNNNNNNNQNKNNTSNDKPSQQQQQQQQQEVVVKQEQEQEQEQRDTPPPPPSSMEALKCSSLFTSSSSEDDDDEEEEEEEVAESNRHNRIEKPKKHIRWRTHDDDDDDYYDTKYNYSNKENRTFSSSSSSSNRSPNRKKRESPSKSKKNKDSTKSPVKTTKSYGISPLSFHRHKTKTNNNNNNNSNNDDTWKDEFHQSVSDKVLLQEKQEYRTQLEQQRKTFKKKTCLKRWPIQQMAMDHLHHLLSPNSSNKQYHGGEYLSGESSSGSSISSSEEKKIRRISSATGASSSSSSSDDNNDDGDGDGDDENVNEKAKAAAAKSSSSQDHRDIVIDTDEPLWSMEPRIFATEKAKGKRKYLVGHFGRIADWYWRKSDATSKHLYEVIRENTPCRLYFDLEYSKIYNTDVDSQKLLDEFLIEIKADLQQYYNIQFTKHQLIDLDSTTDVKFSKHWIFDFDSQGLFEDAPCVGRFVKRLVGRLAEELATGVLATKGHTELAKNLFVQTKDSIKDNSDGTKSSNSKPSCFVDLGVYTKNRLFRVLGSSKFGKTVSLQPSATNLYPNVELPKKQQQQQRQQVSSSPEATTSPKAAITDLTTIEDYIKANDWRPHARALANTLVIPLKETKASGDGDTSGDDKGENRRILTVADDEASRFRPSRGSGGASKTTIRTLGIRRSVTESFLPSLDQYVFDVLATRGDVQGTIRAVSVEYGGANSDEPISITYQLSRNRYCELIGRQHKSNNVYWTISDLGTTWTCIQGCHDPECFGRGCPITISKNDKHYPAIEREWQSFQEEQFENALLALNMDDITNIANDDDDKSSKNKMNNEQKEEENEQSQGTISYSLAEGNTKERNDGDDEYGLSDTALLEAALSNPELFP